jgi:hypothetical protein
LVLLEVAGEHAHRMGDPPTIKQLVHLIAEHAAQHQ